jgi:hypothetical protein
MKTALLCVAFYGLGVFNCAVFAAVCLLHRPRYVAPTMRRKQSLQSVKQEPPPMPVCKPARTEEVGGISYQWLGVTGSEQE